ncbi:MAG TPA: hypothetical protein VG942_17515 [Hyphomonadaceae bacterium]|nr:hypothetical protein [Hyphomonadaceae bacterium]
MTENPIPPLSALWQSMPTDPVTISVEQMRNRAGAFEKRIRRRNRIEYVASAFVIVAFCWYATWSKPATVLWPIANILIALGVAVVAFNLHRKASAMRATSSTFTGLIEHQRAELARQRDALKSVWLWYIMPVVPGFVLWFAAFIVAPVAKGPTVPVALLAVAFVCVLVFSCIILLNLLGAARLQRMIDDLDRYREQN